MAIKRKLSEEKIIAELQVNKKKKTTETMKDRLSDLPEALQLRILASLDAKNAVRTTVLSRTWVSLWARIPVLEFNPIASDKLPAFDKFVTNVLGRRDHSSKLDILSFNRGGSCSAKILNTLFDYAFSHGVKKFEVYIKQSRNNTWPVCQSGSFDSLKSLKLQSQTNISCPFLGPRSILFKNLTVLHLRRAIIPNLESFSGFPVLESLTLVNCHLESESESETLRLHVHALRLTDLTISSYEGINGCELTTPRLRSFKYRGPDFPILKANGGLPVLETVVIDFSGDWKDGQEKKMLGDLISLFCTLQNVKSLMIFSSVVKLMSLCRDELKSSSPFWKLKDLKLDCMWWFDSHGVPFVVDYLLQNSPDAKLSFTYTTVKEG